MKMGLRWKSWGILRSVRVDEIQKGEKIFFRSNLSDYSLSWTILDCDVDNSRRNPWYSSFVSNQTILGLSMQRSCFRTLRKMNVHFCGWKSYFSGLKYFNLNLMVLHVANRFFSFLFSYILRFTLALPIWRDKKIIGLHWAKNTKSDQ